ncbi:MAG: hypothetical protein VKP63_03895 [Cyanobacteriota bacterium]|nr:hypothetical protein [Cyanobacteriota bacterium]
MTVRPRLPLGATSTTAILFGAPSLRLLWPLLRPAVASAAVVRHQLHRRLLALSRQRRKSLACAGI